MSLVMVVVTVVSAGMADAVTTASIIYIPSGPDGSYLMAQDTSLHANDSFLTLPTKNICTCRRACRTSPRCVATGLVALNNNKWECRLSDKRTNETSDRARVIGDTYIFWQASLPSVRYFWTLEDDLAYMVVEEKMAYKPSRQFCASIPGHRLAIIRSVQTYKAMKYLSRVTGSYLRVDLTNSPGNDPTLVWGDNSTYENVRIGINPTTDDHYGYSIYSDGKLHHSPLTHLIYPLCQANPLKVKW